MKKPMIIILLVGLFCLPLTLAAADKAAKVDKIDKIDKNERGSKKTTDQRANRKKSKPSSQVTTQIVADQIQPIEGFTYFPLSPETGELMGPQLLSMGATNSSSASFGLKGAVGQLADGLISSVSSKINQGFWQKSGPKGCCGMYTSGYSGNTTCDVDGKRNLADITRLIDRVYINKTDLCCEQNGNVDGDPELKLNLADITALIDHVYINKAQTAPCV